MAFAIMRCSKIKSAGAVANSLSHCFRERETPNADEERTGNNVHLYAKSKSEAMGKMRSALPDKRRKDAVIAVEYVLTASPEWWRESNPIQHQDFFDKSMEWIYQKYGYENVFTASIHNDELTPHLSVFVVPMTSDGRLSAKEMIGNKTKMVQDQTDYAKAVEHLGLDRGIQGSKATHQRVQSHYAALQQADKLSTITINPELVKPKVLGKSFFREDRVESAETVAERISDLVNTAIKPLADIAAESLQERRNMKSLRETIDRQRNRIESLGEPFKGLSKDQTNKLHFMVNGMKRQNDRERENTQDQEHEH